MTWQPFRSCAAEGPRVSYTTGPSPETVYVTVDNEGLDAQGAFTLSFLISDPACGDGFIDPWESCDDGELPAQGADGCSASCQTEPGFVCVQEGMPCRAIVCGDGIVDGSEGGPGGGGECGPMAAQGEQCDDLNAAGSDGCSADCEVEAGYDDED